ncbi:uncharacterized protein [Anoplolepis gracilipes]|uniref:uncharacterized protein n=1 Tax=Anoplolepis gracilipes TaxID=354296 RepID=UPI003BA1AC5D
MAILFAFIILCNKLRLQVIFPCVMGEICLRLLQNSQETEHIWRKPGHIWLWNGITEEFEQLEALKWNNTAFCSVNAINDMRGKTVIVTADSTNPFITDRSIVDIYKNKMTKLIGDIWTTLEEALKFKTIYRGTKGTVNATLMNGDTHALLVTTSYSYTSSYYTYSMPFTTISYALFVQPEDIIEKQIFNLDLSLTILIFPICITFIIMGIDYGKKRICINYKELNDEFSSLSFTLLYILGGMMSQGYEKVPRSWSLRLIMLSVMIIGMLILYAASSILLSFLTSRNFVPLANLEDVMIKRTHSLCVRKSSILYPYFTVDGRKEGELQLNWKGLVNNNCFDLKDKEFASKLCRPGFVYLEMPALFLLIYHKVKHNCQLIQLPDTYWKQRVAFIHARVAQHRQLIDNCLMRMRSAGIVKYLEKKILLSEIYSHVDYSQSSNFQPVEYQHVCVIIYFFFTMSVISVFICILENLWYKYSKKKNSNSMLLKIYNNNLNVTNVRYKARSRFERSQKFKSILSKNIKNPAFLQNVKVRINRW